VCISVYIGTGNSISLAKAYTVMTVFNLVAQPIRILPQFVGQMVEFMVSMRRIQAYLACKEINPTILSKN